MKYLLIALVLSGCYVCPSNGDAMPASMFEAERNAACLAVPGCDPEFMRTVRVYRAPLSEMADICNQPANACYCGEMNCRTIVISHEHPEDALHEWIHAAIDSAGILEEEDHGAMWWQYYRDAAALMEVAP